MKSRPDTYKVKDLVALRAGNMLDVNSEYQRGAVWGATQKKKLLDSILRGYPIPLIYLHDIKKEIAGLKKENFDIIDGQQRLNAIYEFVEGAFSLFDPVKDEKAAKFPRFIKNQDCPWGGKGFSELPTELQDQLLDTLLSVILVETDDANEVRDLFVRLQSGLPLNAQETRDSWPGEFTDFVLRLGGKAEVARYPGHSFFTRLLGMKPGTDRGKARQLAAQLAMIYFTRRATSEPNVPDIGAKAINDFYYENVDFDRSSNDAKRLVDILSKATELLGDGKRPKLRAHDAIHLVLLLDDLWDGYTRSWEANLGGALDSFLHGVAIGKTTKDAATPSEYWSKYAQLTRVGSDRGSHISSRHKFYLEKMLPHLGLVPKDPNRSYGDAERTLIYYQASKCCEICDSEVPWKEAEIHHVLEHSSGGGTVLANGALVHKKCHPKSDAEVAAFAKKFAKIKRNRVTRSVLGGEAFNLDLGASDEDEAEEIDS